MPPLYLSCLRPGLLRSACNPSKNWLLQTSRPVALRPTPAATDNKEDFFDKNERLGRPMSPHLTIYRPQLTSMLSITHRITGMAVSGYIYCFSIGMMAMPNSFPHIVQAVNNMNLYPSCIYTAKFMLAFPFVYHLCNGIRHLMWDMAKGLELQQVYLTGYTMLGFSLALTLVLMLI